MANFPTLPVLPVPCHFPERRVNKRKRKKHYIKELKKQVSFYFSDSNLSKDKYLRDLIQQDVHGYVSVRQIASFNKILEISSDEKLLLRAISEIPWLEFSADELSVRRNTPINFLYCADDRTIYIENLPPRLEHKKLEHVLSTKFGPISHISLPRFKKNREFKGFGFVEFENCKDAEKALKALGWTDPDYLPKPPSTLEVPPSTPLVLKCAVSTPSTPTTVSTVGTAPFISQGAADDMDVKPKRRKRCRRSSFCVSDLPTPVSDRSSLNSATPHSATPKSCHGNNQSQHSTDPLDLARKRKRASGGSVSPVSHKMVRKDDSTVSETSESEDKRKSDLESGSEISKSKLKILRKKRRRKKKKLRLKEQISLQDIRVFPKLKWMELKTVYKRVQKQQIAVVKGDLGRVAPPVATNRLVKLTNIPDKYQPDDIKALFQGPVCIVECQDNNAYVRFSTNTDILSDLALPGQISIAKLSTEEEALYLSKIAAQRRQRYVDSKRKKMRGYNKVIKRCSELDQTAIHNTVDMS